MIEIANYIPVGHENAITGKELAKKLHVTERDIRESISKARRNTIILNMQDGRGFFIPAKTESALVERWLKQEESRLKRHALSLKSARHFRRTNDGQ